jgi:hypothetical protein
VGLSDSQDTHAPFFALPTSLAVFEVFGIDVEMVYCV